MNYEALFSFAKNMKLIQYHINNCSDGIVYMELNRHTNDYKGDYLDIEILKDKIILNGVWSKIINNEDEKYEIKETFKDDSELLNWFYKNNERMKNEFEENDKWWDEKIKKQNEEIRKRR
jgi:hypothetical protein